MTMDSSSEEETLLLALGVVLPKIRRRRHRRCSAREVNRDRRTRGEFANLVQEMWRLNDEQTHFEYFRMSKQSFEELLSIVGPKISHSTTHRAPVSTAHRLSLTIRFLATGIGQRHIGHSYHLGASTVHSILRETLSAIWSEGRALHLPHPSLESWKQNERGFWNNRNFPNALGALDGKHIQIKAPNNSGSLFFNYKNYFSTVLIAVGNADYKFVYIDVGSFGSQSDGGIWKKCSMQQALAGCSLNIPEEKALPGDQVPMPHVLLADEAFLLHKKILRPYPGKNLTYRQLVFNYRLSRARIYIENIFGIFVAKWRIFEGPINCQPEMVDSIVLASVILHNLCREKDRVAIDPSRRYVPAKYTDIDNGDGSFSEGSWRSEICLVNSAFQSTGRIGANRSSNAVKETRDHFKDYFATTDALSWQNRRIFGRDDPPEASG